MNTPYQSITNKKEINLAFIKLSIDDDDQKYIWNGTGDGLSFRIAMIEIVNRFAEKDLKRFLDGPVHDREPPLPTEDVWITTQMNELEKIVTEYRLLQYNQVGSRYGFPAVNNLNIGFNIASLLPEDQVRIRNEVYQIEDDYHNDIRDIRLKYPELSQNYFDLARMHRRKNEKILHDRNCAALFKELISPDCLYCCSKELNEHAFHIAWQRICNTYNTIPDSEVRFTVFNKIMNMVYRPEEQTLVEFFQEMEQLWSLLLVQIPAPPSLHDLYPIHPKLVDHPPPVEVEAGGLSNGERIEFIRRALCKSTEEFNNVFQHCKWTNKTYDETKALLLETNQENINNYLEQLQSSNAETQPICYRCGKQGHKSYQCKSRKITTYNLNTKEPIVNDDTTSSDGHKNGYKSDSSVYSRSSRDGRSGSEKSRNLKSERNNKSKKGKNSNKKRVTFEDRDKSYRKSRNQSSLKW